MKNEPVVKAVVYSADGQLVAQCIDYDICAFAATPEELTERLRLMIKLAKANAPTGSGDTLEHVGPPPREFLEMYQGWINRNNQPLSEEAFSLAARNALPMVGAAVFAPALGFGPLSGSLIAQAIRRYTRKVFGSEETMQHYRLIEGDTSSGKADRSSVRIAAALRIDAPSNSSSETGVAVNYSE